MRVSSLATRARSGRSAWDCSESPIREGQFEYRGGSLPAPCREALPQLTPALDAIAGLRGFVGVDFIWNHHERRVPRFSRLTRDRPPRTSGLSGLLPLGLWHGRGWRPAILSPGDLELLTTLADYIHGDHRSLIIHGQRRAHCMSLTEHAIR